MLLCRVFERNFKLGFYYRRIFSAGPPRSILGLVVAIIAAFALTGASPALAGKAAKLAESSYKVYIHWGLKEIAAANLPGFCWRKSYGRGVGRPLSTCRDGETKSGALCYPKCKDGYKAVGPVCWQDCPSGFRDDGMFCAKPKPYGRGAGYPWKFGDTAFSLNGARQRCAAANPGGCEKWGAIIYPKCKTGFHAAACCVCSPDCPTGSGMTDIGVSCAKQSYGNGWGTTLKCKPGEDEDAALCYDKCKLGYSGVGPVCWQQCPAGMVNCGMGCAKSSEACGSSVGEMIVAPLEMVASIAGLVATAGGSAAATSAVKTAAKTGVKASVKAAVKKFAQDHIKESVRKSLAAKLATKLAPDVAEGVVVGVAETLAVSGLSVAEPEVKDILISLDPTGVAGVVDTFNQDQCPLPSPLPDVPETRSAAATDLAATAAAGSATADLPPCQIAHGILFKYRDDYYGVEGTTKRKFASAAARQKCGLTEFDFMTFAENRTGCVALLRDGDPLGTGASCDWNPWSSSASANLSSGTTHTCDLPENMLYKLPASDQIWYLRDGKRHVVKGGDAELDACFFSRNPFDYKTKVQRERRTLGKKTAVALGAGLLDQTIPCFEGLPEGTTIDKVNGLCDFNEIPASCTINNADTLLQAADNPRVYAIVAGTKRHIADQTTFGKCGFSWDKIVQQPPSCIDRMPTGTQIATVDGECDADPVPRSCNGLPTGVYFTHSINEVLYYFDGTAKRKVDFAAARECRVDAGTVWLMPDSACASRLSDGLPITTKAQCPSQTTAFGMDTLVTLTDKANADKRAEQAAEEARTAEPVPAVTMSETCQAKWTIASKGRATISSSDDQYSSTADTNNDGSVDKSEWAATCSG